MAAAFQRLEAGPKECERSPEVQKVWQNWKAKRTWH